MTRVVIPDPDLSIRYVPETKVVDGRHVGGEESQRRLVRDGQLVGLVRLLGDSRRRREICGQINWKTFCLKNHLKNHLRFHFDYVNCLNYPDLNFFSVANLKWFSNQNSGLSFSIQLVPCGDEADVEVDADGVGDLVLALLVPEALYVLGDHRPEGRIHVRVLDWDSYCFLHV